MRPPPLLLALSLAANAALLAALALRPSLAPPAVRDFLPRPDRSAPPLAAAPRPLPAAAAPPRTPLLWPALSTDNLREFVARLRAAGFPAAIIRALVTAEIQRRYLPRLAALEDPDPSTPFWKLPSFAVANADPDRLRAVTGLQRELRNQLRDLLGDEFFADTEVTARERRQFGDLPRATIAALQAIEGDYADMHRLARGAMQGVELPADREALALLRREKHADLAAVLTPSELADYELRTSPAADRVRSALTLFPATEDEYRAIVRLQNTFDDQSPPPLNGFFDPAGAQHRAALSNQLIEDIRAVIGDARFADYLRDTSYEFRQLTELVRREELPPESAKLTWNLREQVARESNRILDDPALGAAQQRAALQALAQSTRAQFNLTLGGTAGPVYAAVADPWLSGLARGNAVTFVNGQATFRSPRRPAEPAPPTR